MENNDVICFCRNVTYGKIVEAVKNGAKTIDEVGAKTSAGTTCGACKTRILNIIKEVSK